MRPFLLITRNFPPATGGIETLAAELVAHALRIGEPIVVVHIGQKPLEGKDRGGVTAYHHLPGSHRLSALFVSLLTIPLLVAYYRPRSIINLQVTTAASSWLVTRFLGIPYFVMAMGLEVLSSHDPWLKPVKALSLRGARKVVSISRFTDGLVSVFGLNPERRAVVVPGTRFWPAPTASQTRESLFGEDVGTRFVCLSLSRLVPRKGIDVALEAVSIVLKTRQDILYCIGGSGPDLPRLRAIASEKGLGNRVRFLGRLPDEEVGAAYARADLFLLPSREMKNPPEVEGFGIVFLEAGACGTPSLAGNSGGVPDAVVDGETGYLVNPTDPHSIAAKILLLMENRPLLEKLGEGALAHSRESTWEKACARYYAVFTEGKPGR